MVRRILTLKAPNPNSHPWPNWPAYDPRAERWMNLGATARMEKINSAGIDIIAAIRDERRQNR